MNRYSFNQSQLYALVLFSGIIPVIALVLGFHLAWQYHDEGSGKGNSEASIEAKANLTPVVHSDELVKPNVAVATPPDLHLESENMVLIDTPAEKLLSEDRVGSTSTIDTTSAQSTGMGLDQAFALQLGAFREKSRAIAWASLKQLEYDAVHLLEREIDGQIYYCVAVGHFDQKDQAREAQKTLAEISGESSYVIEYQKTAKEIVLSS